MEMDYRRKKAENKAGVKDQTIAQLEKRIKLMESLLKDKNSTRCGVATSQDA